MKSIRNKLVMLAMALVLGTSLIIGGVCNILLYKSNFSTVEDALKETAMVATMQIDSKMSTYKAVAYEVGSEKRLSTPTVSENEKKVLLEQRVKTYGFHNAVLTDLTGKSMLSGYDDLDANTEYFKLAATGIANMSDPIIEVKEGHVDIMVVAPLWKDGVAGTEVIGIVGFRMHSFLNDAMASFKVSENGYAYINDKNGTCIAYPDPDYVVDCVNIIEEAETDKSLKKLAEVEEKMRNGESGFGTYEYNGVSKVVAYAPIAGNNGWSLAVNAPVDDFMGSVKSLMLLSGGIVIVLLVAAFFVSVWLANGVAGPITHCITRLKALENGDLTSEVPEINKKDETGDLAKAIGHIVSRLNAIIGDLQRGLGAIANGDLCAKSEAEFPGDFEAIKHALELVFVDLNMTINHINEASEQVAVGSEHVSRGAQALSQGTTEQASSIEELSATMRDMTESINQSANNLQQANVLVASTSNGISACNKQMKDMMSAMDDIAQSSMEINTIIKTIDDIAFQTNILALNAAVEAARAGTAGAGFAVVANEVRNLAQKSSEAANNTTMLIQQSMKSVNVGMEIAEETARSLEEIVSNSSKMTGVINEIADASNLEAVSSGQVADVIDQISTVVHSNAATADESAATSEELAGQANILKDLVSRFKFADIETMREAYSILHSNNMVAATNTTQEPAANHAPAAPVAAPAPQPQAEVHTAPTPAPTHTPEVQHHITNDESIDFNSKY